MPEYTNGFSFGLDPVLARIGPVSVRWFAFCIALGITVGVYLAIRQARQRGIASGPVYTAALWCLVAGIVGARLFHLVDKLDYYLQNPYLLPSLYQGGMAVWGGILGGLVALLVYSRRHSGSRAPAGGLQFVRLADLGTAGLAAGLAIGRIGSLVNGESWGTQTTLPWAIIYTNPDARLPVASLGIPTHPYPIYEGIAILVAYLVSRLARRGARPGVESLAFLLVYAFARFGLTYVREEGIVVFGLQQAQLVAAAVLLVGLPWLVWLLTGRPSAESALDQPRDFTQSPR